MNQQTDPTPDELTKERNLWELFKSSSVLPTSKITERLKLGMITALAAYVSGTGSAGDWGVGEIASTVRAWASEGLSFSSQVIGFVIAGFTVFATMNAREFTLALARHREPTTQHSFLKYVYLSFMRVFMLYIGFIALCLAVRLLGSPGGFVSLFIKILPEAGQFWAKSLIARASFVLLGSWFWFVVVDLYAFMFNVYHTVMSAARWELERKPDVTSHSIQEPRAVTETVSTPSETVPSSNIQAQTAVSQQSSEAPRMLTLLRNFARHVLTRNRTRD
ncbi:MAG TPA: hypothetical protein VK539_06885 [Myxococcaceae bacterium]|nr:hypothetical protein [Myxococcaceae bacterium]